MVYRRTLSSEFGFGQDNSGRDPSLAAGSLVGRFEIDRQAEVSPQPEGHRGTDKPELQALLPDIEARLP
jgi:hypothetical protein